MKYLLAGVALCVLAACGAPDPVAPKAPPTVALAIDLSVPETPTMLTAAIVGTRDVYTDSVVVSWQDNSAFLDEFGTCFWFTDAATGEAITTQCLYARASGDGIGYEEAAWGSTGLRTGKVITAHLDGQPQKVRADVCRYFPWDENINRSVCSGGSDAIDVAPLVTVTSTKRKGKPTK